MFVEFFSVYITRNYFPVDRLSHQDYFLLIFKG